MNRFFLLLCIVALCQCARLKPSDVLPDDGQDGGATDGSSDVSTDPAVEGKEASPEPVEASSDTPSSRDSNDAGTDESESESETNDDATDAPGAADSMDGNPDAGDASSDNGDASSDSGDAWSETGTDGEPMSDGLPQVEAGADVAPEAGWSPLSLPGLALWLEAGVGMELDGDKVNAWNDLSPNHHRAFSYFVTQPPVLIPEGIGQHAGVAFSGTGDMLIIPDAPSLRFGTGDFVVEIIFRQTTLTTHFFCQLDTGFLYGKVNANRPFVGLEMFADSKLSALLDGYDFAQSNDGIAYNDDVARAVAAYRRAQTISIRVNGSPIAQTYTSQAASQPINVDAVGYDVYIGAQPGQIQCLRGVIAEIVAVSNVTTSDVAALDGYLLAKYKNAIQHP